MGRCLLHQAALDQRLLQLRCRSEERRRRHPRTERGLHGTLEAEDLMTGRRFTLNGKGQWLRLDPGDAPFVLWRLWSTA